MIAATSGLAGNRSVSAAEASGTYRDGKSEIKILSVDPGKLKVQMEIVQPRDTGSASGEATIKNDVAIFVPPDTGWLQTDDDFPAGRQSEGGAGRASC